MHFLLGVLLLLVTTCVQASPWDEAVQLQADIGLKESTGFLDSTPAYDESYQLPVGEALQQGNTNFCWAYSAFHMLRTYYGSLTDASAETARWHSLIATLNNTNSLYQYVLKNAGYDHGGWPIQAIGFFEGSVKATRHLWASFIPTTGNSGWGQHSNTYFRINSYYDSYHAIEQRIRRALATGAPAAYCTIKHCVTIYGAAYRKGHAVTYLISDSVTKQNYPADPTTAERYMADVTTLWQ